MKYNYHAVDTHTITLNGIIKAMEDNLQNIRTLRNNLQADFSGAGAEGYGTIMKQLDDKMTAYGEQLQNVHRAISDTSGSQGFMNLTDKNQGNRFLNIKA